MCNFSNGPWIAAFNGIWYEVKSHNEDWIADTCASSCKGDLALGEANAHLIAAAPEMYELLSNIKQCIENGHPFEEMLTEINAHALSNEIEKLLAKARGEHA